MRLYRKLRAVARPLRRVLPRQPKLYADEAFLSYVARKRDGLLARRGDIETIALGSSTADYAFLPDLEDRAYNLGLISADLHATYHQYLYAKSKLDRLRNIVIFGAVFVPGYCLQKTAEGYRSVAYRYFFDVPLIEGTPLKSKNVAYIERRCKSVPALPLPPDYLGYQRKTYYGTTIPASTRIGPHLRENLREPDQMIWLQRLLDDADVAGHRVLILIPPFRSDYRAELEKALNSQKIFEKYYALNLREHQVLNYYASADFGDECLGDTDHLNEKGARRLTQEIMWRVSEERH